MSKYGSMHDGVKNRIKSDRLVTLYLSSAYTHFHTNIFTYRDVAGGHSHSQICKEVIYCISWSINQICKEEIYCIHGH